MEKISVEVQNELSHKVFKHFMNDSIFFHEKNGPYKLFRDVMTESKKSGDYYLNILQIINCIIVIFTVCIFVYLVNKDLFFISIIFLFISAYLYYFFTRRSVTLKSKLLLKLRLTVVRVVLETFALARELITNKLFYYQERKYLDQLKKYQISQVIIQTFKKLPRYFYESIALLIIFIIVNLLVNLGYDKKYIFTLLSIFLVSVLRILPSLIAFSSQIIELGQNKISYDAIIMKLKKKEPDIKNYSLNKITNIKIKKLSFKYNNNFIFHNLNLNLNNFKSVGIMGESGSGKSTLAKLICNYLDDFNGEIVFNNKIKNKKNNYLNFFYLDNKSFLLNGSIKKNILFFSKYEKKKFFKILSLVQLKKNLVNRQAKFDDQDSISTGQKQRVVLARALYKNPSLIILDEILSNLDEKNVNKIITGLEKFSIPYIILSHNVKHLFKCDHIFEVSKKKLKRLK
jgi:ABC-type bacteriocin/lantibiotic exporter with double-glycine peptidase domain